MKKELTSFTSVKRGFLGLAGLLLLVFSGFVLAAGLPAPVLSTPSNNAQNISTTSQNFTWSSVTDATIYRILVVEKGHFPDFVDKDAYSYCTTSTNNVTCFTKRVELTTFVGFPLKAGTDYEWYVRAGSGATAQSKWNFFYFKTAAIPTTNVLLDPGHGSLMGIDGERHYQRPLMFGSREDDYTLLIGLKARDKLVKDNQTVYMTRTTSEAPYNGVCDGKDPKEKIDPTTNTIAYCNDDLRLRMAMADKLKLDKDTVFVSIHTNGGSARRKNGRTQALYCSDVSRPLAVNLLNEIEKIAPPLTFAGHGEINNCADAVLRRTNLVKIPASLLEVLYHNNEDDAALLIDDTFRINAGNGIAKAIEDFIKAK